MQVIKKIKISNLFEIIKGSKSKKLQLLEEKDTFYGKCFSVLADSLNSPPLNTQHPLRSISKSFKNELIKYQTASNLELINVIQNSVEKENKKTELFYSTLYLKEPTPVTQLDESYIKFQTSLRVNYLHRYLNSLKKNIESGEISSKNVNSSQLLTLIDTILLGNGTERVSAHLKLYRSVYTQPTLQNSLYMLYNDEVDSISNAVQLYPEFQKQQKKKLSKLARVYLLDTLELNTKSRCIFAWADNDHVSFQEIDELKEIPVDIILQSRLKYFDEGNSIAKLFIDSYYTERRVEINDKDENRQNIRLGSIFLVVTCLIDWYLCTI